MPGSRAGVGADADPVTNVAVSPGFRDWLRPARGKYGWLDHSCVGRSGPTFRDLFRQSQIMDDFLLTRVHRTQDETGRLGRRRGRKAFWSPRVRTTDRDIAVSLDPAGPGAPPARIAEANETPTSGSRLDWPERNQNSA